MLASTFTCVHVLRFKSPPEVPLQLELNITKQLRFITNVVLHYIQNAFDHCFFQ